MFTDRLKELRIEKNLTQKQLADMLMLSKNSICEYEKGRSEPNIDTLVKLSDIFDCSIDYLVGKSDDFYLTQYANVSDKETIAISLYKKLPEDMQKYVLNTLDLLSKYQKTTDKK